MPKVFPPVYVFNAVSHVLSPRHLPNKVLNRLDFFAIPRETLFEGVEGFACCGDG